MAVGAAAPAVAQSSTTTAGSRDNSQQGSSHQLSQSDQKKFVQKMMVANMAEIQLGQLAETHASNPDVKTFAEMMVTDHTKANEQLMPIAQQLGVTPQTELDSKHRSLADKLSKLQGADFDRQFMKAMVDAHEDVVKDTRPVAGAAAAARGGTTTSTDTGTTASTAGSSSASGAVGTSGTAGAASVDQYAAQTLPVVEQHLQRAREIRQSVGK
jgi:putative membrane protein